MVSFIWQIEISPGVWMPTIGFGTAGLGDSTKQAVTWALQAGYKLIDSAQVGLGLRLLRGVTIRMQ